MKLRVLLVLAVAVLGIAAVTIPTLASGDAPPTSASFTAVDDAWQVTGSSANTATIAQGGIVTFGYPSGSSMHNVDFGTGPQPSSCTQSAGASSGAVPPLPELPTAPGWSGSCTFNTPGTYTFHCDQHSFMTGTITVLAPGETTSTTTSTSTSSTSTTTSSTPTMTVPMTMTMTTTTPTTKTTTSTPSRPTMPATDRSPLAGSAARAIVIAHRQRGHIVRGSLNVAPAGVHGTATISARATAGQLRSPAPTGPRARRLLSVGTLKTRLTRSGSRSFAVTLDRAAQTALSRGRVLSLTVVVTVRSPQGAVVSARRGVLLRRSGA